QLGGFYLIDVPDLDAAIAIAAQLPPAARGTVEIRPVMAIDGKPPESPDLPAPSDGSLKKYLLIAYDNEQIWEEAGESEHLAAVQQAVALIHELHVRKQFLAAAPLHHSSTATCVRVREGRAMLTDGPFTETNEVIGGFYLFLAATPEEAAEIARRHCLISRGAAEIREVVPIPATPVPTPCQIMNVRDFPFTPAEISAAIADPNRLARWWGPTGFRNDMETFEFRDGGMWKFTMISPDGTVYPNENKFVSISPEQIVIRHLSAPEFLLEMSLVPLPGNTTRLIWMMTFASAELRNKLAAFVPAANEQNFDRLNAELIKE
ncbi:MAG: SRPBCC domain-containing protein, partial [Planctomycetaceae bacterium]|nr:SRPBCC domain-containing protein [Planctomycetaceae bacterium]